jgi:hypothetical protein
MAVWPLLLFWSIGLAGTPRQASAPYTTPEEAAVSRLAGLKGPVKLDRRFALRSGGEIEFENRIRSPDVTRRIAVMLNAELDRYESVRVCDPHDVSRGEYPWSRCRLNGAHSFVGVSEPTITGSDATVFVTVWWNTSDRIQPIAAVQWEALVRKDRSGWRLTKLTSVAAT